MLLLLFKPFEPTKNSVAPHNYSFFYLFFFLFPFLLSFLLPLYFFNLLIEKMSIYVPFDDQKKQDASFTLQSMGIQLGVNIGTAIVVMIGFSLLRPVCMFM